MHRLPNNTQYLFLWVIILFSVHPKPLLGQDCPTICVKISIKLIKSSQVQPIPPLCSGNRFGSVNVYSESQLEQKNGLYANSTNYLGTAQNLNFEFVAPANDTLSKRPFVLMIHEGAFLFGELGAEMGKARLLARKGYAAAAINYRLGFENASEANPCGSTSPNVIKALYRAVQDTKAALRYFVAHSNEFKIDPDQLFLAGSSSGSMTITALNYMTEADFENLLPGIVQELGSLDQSGNNLTTSYKIKGLMSYLGYGILNTNLITAGNVKPTLIFQGANDTVLPYTSGPLYNCGQYFTTYGSYPAVTRLKQLQKPFEWIVQSSAGHITTYSNEFITERYAEFMKRIWCNDLRQVSWIDQTIIENLSIK
ncbi:alpha/beta hydrolase [Runella sp.]|uniref:alpha/beta hydrolase n=1 Tax=Runella sp. TaxID=1960881 RepID=UPI0030167A75